MSTTPPSTDLQTQISALSTRLSAIDGQGLPNPSTCFVTTATKKIGGLKEDLSQSVMSLEGLLTTVNTSIMSLWSALATALGITPPPTTAPPTVVPPSGS